MSLVPLLLLLLCSSANTLPISNSNGFALEAGASWWQPQKGPSGAKVGGDGTYLTEVFRSNIFEPLTTKIIGSLHQLTDEIQNQSKFDTGIIIGAIAIAMIYITYMIITSYRNTNCCRMEDK